MYEILFLTEMDVDRCGSIIEFHLNEHMLEVQGEPILKIISNWALIFSGFRSLLKDF